MSTIPNRVLNKPTAETLAPDDWTLLDGPAGVRKFDPNKFALAGQTGAGTMKHNAVTGYITDPVSPTLAFPDLGFRVGTSVPAEIKGSAGSLILLAKGLNRDITLVPSGTGGVKIPVMTGGPSGSDVWIRVPWQAPIILTEPGYIQQPDTMNLIIGNGGTNISRGSADEVGNPVNPVSEHGQNNGTHCTFLGLEAGTFNTTGNYNTFLGSNAGRGCINGDQNTYVGSDAGWRTTSGYMNVAIGADCLNHITTGYLNTFVGCDCGNTAENHMTGFNNVAMGAGAGNISSADNSVYIGASSGCGTILDSATGDNNTCVGALTLMFPKNCVDNVAIGLCALQNTSGTVIPNQGCYNTAVGCSAMLGNTTGQGNVAVGRQALITNTEGSNNVAIGQNALKNNTTANGNVAIGDHALFVNTTGTLNTAVGASALFNGSGSENTAVGNGSLQNNTGSFNAAFGVNALYTNAAGAFNAAFGRNALYGNTTGGSNTAVGGAAMQNATIANSSVAVGMNALRLVTTGTQNTAIGSEALYNNVEGSRNVALGMRAGTYELGSDAFYVDNQDRADTLTEKASALLYGIFAASPVNQRLTINAYVGIRKPSIGEYELDVNGVGNFVNGVRSPTLSLIPGGSGKTAIMFTSGGAKYGGIQVEPTNSNGAWSLAHNAGAGDAIGTPVLTWDGSNRVVMHGAVIHALSAPPASATAPGVAGQVAWDAGFEYRCIATNSWKRAALAAW